MARLAGMTAIVTGGAQGIGRGCAIRCAQEGAAVVIADVQDDRSTAEKIERCGGRALHVTMDVRDRSDWARTVTAALETFGRLDLLGNVAGVVNMESPDTMVDLTDAAWATVLDTDLKGTWLGMQAVLPTMIAQRKGSIVNISSMAAYKGHANLASYTAAKAGVLGLTRQAAVEYAGQGVRVNCICPGTIDTPILEDVAPEVRDASVRSHILKRLGTPEDVAAMMALFFSPDGAHLTGNSTPVDGGWYANGRAE